MATIDILHFAWLCERIDEPRERVLTSAARVAMMVAEIAGAGRSLRGRLLLFDALWGENRQIAIHRTTGCPVCGPHRKDPT
ncbi:hypothetical protein [Shinella sp.]|uniref:hypothetical protein n=1 Tax=Shinella sp. TaxID=1870904 RepID=UPI00301CBA71